MYPFVVFMIEGFGINDHNVGSYTGILSGSYCIAQFLSSFAWGWISDHYGRRTALLIGLFFGMIAMTMFGLSKNYTMAISARIIGGLFNGNLGVIKSYLADITVESNRTFAFSTMSIAYGAGCILGSIAGGMLSNIPLWIFSSDYEPSEYSFPYLIPCFLGSLIALNAFIFGWIYVIDVKDLRKEYYTHNNNNNNVTSKNKNKNKNTNKNKNKISKPQKKHEN